MPPTIRPPTGNAEKPTRLSGNEKSRGSSSMWKHLTTTGVLATALMFMGAPAGAAPQ